MTPKSFFLDEALHAYVVDHGEPLTEVQRSLIADTAALGDVSRMQIAPEQGQLLALLVRLTGARSAIEIGTFTGYSALAIAGAMPADGHLLCCDVSETWTAVARTAWSDAGVADRIELRIAPAIETLRSLPTDASIDFAFIDADKTGYASYFEELLPRLRPNGLIAVDNTLWSGAVVEAPADNDENTVAMRAFNDLVAGDDRVESLILTIGDGLTLIRKR
jgi:caffeoyl-CoA O-methyltransferase